jgi:hypothetical protein
MILLALKNFMFLCLEKKNHSPRTLNLLKIHYTWQWWDKALKVIQVTTLLWFNSILNLSPIEEAEEADLTTTEEEEEAEISTISTVTGEVSITSLHNPPHITLNPPLGLQEWPHCP